MGQAHAEAQEAERKRLQAEVEKKEKQIKDAQIRRARGHEAFAKERQLEEEKHKLEEEILCIERKKQVQVQESNYAHGKAQKYRMEKEHSEILEREIAHLKKDQNMPSTKELKDFKNIDYTQTRFHTIKTTTQPPTRQQHSAINNILAHPEASGPGNSVFVPKSAMITQKLNELQIVQKNNK